ncbi:DUF3718 domain-containing protein [Aliikangiella coralliicola]|uniref:DUF3718 domain-containing protein n=1 Tax=Aliikangiella coralliicola TaxID=2592383 RepID=A0A545UEB4_9GAMM|nr:DUF3718 domain-containing protein [Aliikangiella coralliicola]TQV87811.1 DUF3718 domain-containing protein [Aliikangiella coralliicola]
MALFEFEAVYQNDMQYINPEEKMMKLVKLALASVAAVMSLSASATNYVFVAGNDTAETRICVAAVQNDLLSYRQEVKKFTGASPNSNRQHTLIANKLNCNDKNVALFARKYGAEKTANFITRYLRKTVSIRRDIANLKVEDLDKSGETKVIVVTAK